jgi:hypothetical protein
MIRRNVAIGLAAAFGGMFLSLTVRAEPPRAALIIGSANYASLPSIVGCGRSANAVSAALRALNFQISERQDASTGGIDAGMGEFADRVTNGKGPGFVYICGYATDFNNRTFLLPTTARIGRPSDVITQGVLAKSMLTTVSRDPATVAVVVFDLIPQPGQQPGPPPRIDLDVLANTAVPEGVAIIAATEATTTQGPTPVAAALVAALSGPDVRTDGVIASLRAKLAGNPATQVAWHPPAHPGFLAGGPPPPVALSAPPPPPVAQPVAPPAAAPVAAAPSTPMPAEAAMTEFDRRTVQSVLLRLGYYDRAVDAVFGPETRAAIRRYQHEIGSEMTGFLTAEQATRLVNSR